MATTSSPSMFSHARREWPLLVLATIAAAAMLAKPRIVALVDTPALAGLVLIALGGVVVLGALAIVRHAEVLAHRLGEPGGTLLLTMAITGLEAAMVGLVSSTGEPKPTLARDTMYAVIMLVLNGYLGLALVLGALRHRQQGYNPESTSAFLVMIIPLSVLSLVLPVFTRASPGPTLTAFQMAFLCVSSVAIYAIFLAFQTRWNREFFIDEDAPDAMIARHAKSSAPTVYHVVMLGLYGAAVILVAKGISVPLDALVLKAGAPPALGGFVMAMLVLTPESIAAINAARRNQLQRCVNVLLGSVLASIGLTVPIVVIVSLVTGRELVLGLQPVQIVILIVTLLVSTLTLGRSKTNLLMGSVHLLLFAAAVMLIFDR